MSRSFANVLAMERRRTILELLAETADYESSHYALYQALLGGPLQASAAEVARDVGYLAEHGLVVMEDLEEVLMVRVTQRGVDVAAGRARATGVARPRPEA